MKDLSILMEPLAFMGEEVDRQASWFRSWTSDEWDQPTFCEGWTRKHIVAHSTFGATFYDKVVSSGVQGHPNPPFGATDREGFNNIRTGEIERMLDLPADHLVDQFEIEYHRFQRTVSSVRLEDLHFPAWHPMGHLPVGHFAGMRLFELAIHDWDIRIVDDPKASLRNNLLTPLLRALPFMHVRFLNHRPAAAAPDGAYRFVPVEAVPWTISINRGIADLVEDSQSRAEVTGQGEALILQTTGRKTWKEAEQEGRLSILGEREEAERLLEALAVTY